MKQKGFSPILIILLIAIIGVLGYFSFKYFQTTLSPSPSPIVYYSPTPMAIATLLPSVSPTPKVPANWKTYTNTKYGFEISFPNNFKALDDATNLYGWPNAIVLIYSGGQSYDLPIEVWNTEAQYKAKYTDLSVLKVFKTKDGKFITLANVNKDSTVTEIVSTFKFTN